MENLNWIITNLESAYLSKFKYSHVSKNYQFYSDYQIQTDTTNNIQFIIDGYILPRKNIYFQYKHYKQYNLLIELYSIYGDKFIRYIKGVFNIIIIKNNTFQIYNDRQSIKKFFKYEKDNSFILTNLLENISRLTPLYVDYNNTRLFFLMEHFIDSNTLFQYVNYSKPACFISFINSIEERQYWSPLELTKQELKNYSYNELSQLWNEIIQQYINYLKPKKITLTLTGGNDSRMILASLLNLNINTNTFSFGNPLSHDSVIAKTLAEKSYLNYNNYFVSNPTKDWFMEYSNKIVDFGNSLINIHRAHRLNAIEQEVKNNPETEMILGGFMGGDYLKGIVYDDYITAEIIRHIEYSKEPLDSIIQSILDKNFITSSSNDIQEIMDKINHFEFRINNEKLIREFLFVYNIVGSVHDTQDTNIFGSKIKYTVNPYMDIDFLEIVFSTEHSMLFKNNSSQNPLSRINQSDLHINITNILALDLSNIPYAKNGYYTANEYLGNRLVYIAKRFNRIYLKRKKYPQSFTYRDWTLEFVKNMVSNLSKEIKPLLNEKSYTFDLNHKNHLNTESYWHRFTNLINIDLNYKKFRYG